MNSRRVYREWVASGGLVRFTVTAHETDLLITAQRDLTREALESASKHRHAIESYFRVHPRFGTSLEPQEAMAGAPPVIQAMARAARIAQIGPLAAVAGAIAEAVGNDLLHYSDEVIVENGGDLFIKTLVPRVVALYAGQSGLTGQIGLQIDPAMTPLGICTSAGSFGHSLSFGRADACTVLARSAAVADALATSFCNRIRSSDDLATILDPAHLPPEMLGILATIDGHVGMQGSIQLVPIKQDA
ncbi:MAG: UPF0280 family protein [Dehalococcoidia bacterium]|nr:UPF0280 family protein [Dehalococcoidia bacterium]